MTGGEFVRANLPAALQKLRGLAHHRFRLDKPDVDDLLQEVARLAIVAADQFTLGTNFHAWLYVIMRNVFISDCREAKRRHTAPLLDNLEDAALVRDGTQDSNIYTKEIAAIFDGLPPNFRSAMLAVAMGDSYEQAAERLGINSGTLRSRLWRGRQALERATA